MYKLVEIEIKKIVASTIEDVKDELKLQPDNTSVIADSLKTEELTDKRVEGMCADAYYGVRETIRDETMKGSSVEDIIETVCIETLEEHMEWD